MRSAPVAGLRPTLLAGQGIAHSPNRGGAREPAGPPHPAPVTPNGRICSAQTACIADLRRKTNWAYAADSDE